MTVRSSYTCGLLALVASLPAVGWAEGVVRGEGKTLPENVIRARLPFRAVSASKGYSSSGEKGESGLKLNLVASALVVEYGYSPAVSFQIVAPFILKNEMSMDGSAFQSSYRFKEKYDEFISIASQKLVDDKLCASVEACRDAIQNKGLSLPASTDLVLPTGEKLRVKAGVPIKDVASALVTRAALPESGRTGLGDVEIGTLVALADPEVGLWKKDWPVNLSVGLGLRLPTGSFVNVPAAQRATGRGTLDLGLRTNLDWFMRPNISLSFQNQWEQMLMDGKKKRSSLLDSSTLNTADPLVAGADQIANDTAYKRTGARNIGFLKLALGAAEVAEALKPLILNVQWKYDFDPETTLGGKKDSEESEMQSMQAGFTFDGLVLNLPVQLDADYEIPLAGKNRTLAPAVLSTTLKAFYRL